MPILSTYATHGGAAENKSVAEAMRKAGARIDTVELDSDHAFTDHRIALANELVRWLDGPR